MKHVFLSLLCLAASPVLSQEAFSFRRPCMGTVWTIKIYAKDETTATRAAEAAFDRVEDLNRKLSDYLPDSELSQLSATAGRGMAVTVKGDLLTVLGYAQKAAAESGGVFDITIGPCVQLWRTAKKSRTLPDPKTLEAALAATGWESLTLDPAAGTALLKKPGMKLDVGGIAKGFAQDEAMKVLREEFHITSALIDCGSPLVSARPPGRNAWNVALAKTGDDDDDFILQVENACVDTSGDLNQFVEIDGRRFSHIIDKKTGLGMELPTQATVVAPTATLADWMATALCLMGPEAGVRFAAETHPDVQVRIIQRQPDGQLKRAQSAGFEKLLHKVPVEAPAAKKD